MFSKLQFSYHTLIIIKEQNYVMKEFSFSFIQFPKFVEVFKMLVFAFNEYRCELCTCVNMEIDTCVKILVAK